MQSTQIRVGASSSAISPKLPPRITERRVICRSGRQDSSSGGNFAQDLVATTAAVCLGLGVVSSPVLAGEFDILTEPKPTSSYVLDDANVLSRSTRGTLNKQLQDLENQTGYRLEVATVRKLEFESDPFSFGDKVIEKWYPTVEEGTSKGILLIVTTARDGALTGGPKFLSAVGDNLIDSVISDDIPILTEQEKYNETVLETSKRIEAVLSGKEDPGGPTRSDNTRRRTYRTKQETSKSKSITSTVVATLLFISVVVPMLQYYGYTSKE